MTHRPRRRPRAMSRPTLFAAFALTLSLAGSNAFALRPQVTDAADTFKPQTIDRANQIIRNIKDGFGKDVMIETYPVIPPDMKADFQKKGKERFFRDWNDQRFRALAVDGIYILITRDPGRLQIGVGNVTQRQLFTVADRDELQRVMTDSFRAKQFDEGLIKGLEFVRARLERNAGPAAGPGGVAAPGPGVAMPETRAAEPRTVEAPPAMPATVPSAAVPPVTTTEPTTRLMPATSSDVAPLPATTLPSTPLPTLPPATMPVTMPTMPPMTMPAIMPSTAPATLPSTLPILRGDHDRSFPVEHDSGPATRPATGR